MDDKLKKLPDNISSNFSDWIEKLNAYNMTYSLDNVQTEDEKVDLLYGASGILGEMSEIFFKYGSFKDKFDNSKMYLNFDGPVVIIKSKKTGSTFNLGISNRGIYLETYIRFPENIRHMPDSFYSDILSLETLGEFELIQHEHYGKDTTNKYPEIFNNNKSKLFRIFRNYFVGTAERSDDICLDHFQITWPYKTDFYEVVANACSAFHTLYRLNYDLWKIHDLQTKKNKS